MYRRRICHSGGDTFFDRFRKGISTLESEMDKLQYISNELATMSRGEKSQCTKQISAYYAESLQTMQEMAPIHDSVAQLNQCISATRLDIRPVEQRLADMRERLLRFDESLVASGHRPFLPDALDTPDGPGEPDCEPHLHTVAQVPIQPPEVAHQPVEPAAEDEKEESFSLSRFVARKTKKVDKTDQAESRMAKMASLLDRWLDSDTDRPEVSRAQVSGGIASKGITSGGPDRAKPSALALTPVSCKSGSKPRSLLASVRSTGKVQPLQPPTFDYETVEFTPGMTSKVARF